MIILDTNVLSELMRPSPSDDVVAWLSGQPQQSLFTTTVTEAEIRYGLALLPSGARRDALESAAEGLFAEDLAGRVLPFDRSAAAAYALIAADRRAAGRPIAQLDAQIAAIARSRRAGVATRNVTDFSGCGVHVLDPWG